MPDILPTRGVLYVVFGSKAATAAANSIDSLRKLCPKLAIAIVGDTQGGQLAATKSCNFLEWAGPSPFDPTKATGFHFRAGRVKPSLYGLSPFDRTLYVDADTEFQHSPEVGFDLLDRYCFMLAKHSNHNIGMLNNDKPGEERSVTKLEMGRTGEQVYPNSGVLFWKSCGEVKQLFEAWSIEWQRFREWDEQLALERALFKNPVRFLLLPEAWNGETRLEGSIIFHDFHGTKIAREDSPSSLAGIFSAIHADHKWPSSESVSGPGSEIGHTERLRQYLPIVLKGLKVSSILDAGCGDWNWASQIKLFSQKTLGLEYHGCDVVPELIRLNQEKYPGRHFFIADLTCDLLPKVDLILCRSVLFHLTSANVFKALQNFKGTGAKYLLTTSFPYLPKNDEIQDGRFHRLNLEKPPYNFPLPELLIPEGAEPDGWLCLWKLDQIMVK